MPETTLYAKDFESYIPVLDPRRMAKPDLINGVNFLFDIDGPRSAFGTLYTNYWKYSLADRVKPTPLEVLDDIWYGTPTGLYRHDPVTGELVCMLFLGTQITEIFWPWTSALVGGFYYFCQFGIGLWQYDPVLNTMKKISTPVADAGIKFLTAAYGRLIVLVDNEPADLYMWSSLDDGTDFVPSLSTGAGYQTCGLVGQAGFRIDTVADGFIVSTSSGLIKATYVATNYLWTHRVLSTQIKIFSPNAGVIIPDQGVVLIDRNGMWLSNGAEPQAFDPLMSKYFKDNQLANMDRTRFGCILMYYSIAMQALIVGFAPNAHEGNFTNTFVYLNISQKWGICNRSVYGFMDMILPITGLRQSGCMNYNGYLEYFVETYQSDNSPPAPYSFSDLLWRPPSDEKPETVSEIMYGSSTMRVIENSMVLYNALAQFGLFILKTPNMAPYILPKIGLNSFIEIGPFRFVEQQAADETSALSGVIIGINPVVQFSSFEDWNVLVGAEDWDDAPDTFDDWGEGSGLPDVFTLELTATNDGQNPQLQGAETLYPVNNMGGSISYSPMGYSAIYHRFKISALNPGEGYALKFLDIAGLLTGRMTFNG